MQQAVITVYGIVCPKKLIITQRMAVAPTTETIYINLIDEGTKVARPTEGITFGNSIYKVLPTPDYDPENEHWEFPPGSIVRCVIENWSEGDILIAHELAQIPHEHFQALEEELNDLYREVFKMLSSPKDADQIKTFINVGEYGLALETLCGVIAEDDYTIPDSVYQKIAKLANTMDIEKRFFENINTDKGGQ